MGRITLVVDDDDYARLKRIYEVLDKLRHGFVKATFELSPLPKPPGIHAPGICLRGMWVHPDRPTPDRYKNEEIAQAEIGYCMGGQLQPHQYKLLTYIGIVTMSDLVAQSKTRLREIPGIGKMALEEIELILDWNFVQLVDWKDETDPRVQCPGTVWLCTTH